jgi:glycosyltransferase domain-containing protein
MGNLNDLTIVIPTYERQQFLVRQIELWKDTNSKVLILDGSTVSWLKSFKEKLPANFEYYHKPDNIEKRLHFIKGRITTRYAVLLSDDETYIPSALQKCIDELEGSPDLVACKGLALGFNFLDNIVAGYKVYPGLRNYNIDQETPEDRVNFHMKNYEMAVLWAVTRTDVFDKMLDAMAFGPFLSAAVGEIQCSLIAAWCGKVKVISELMWLRSFENKNIWWSFGNNKFHDWFINPNNKEEVERFITSIGLNVNCSEEEIKIVKMKIINGVENYVEAHFNNLTIHSKMAETKINTNKKEFIGIVKNVILRIFNIMPISDKIRFNIKRIYLSLSKNPAHVSLLHAANDLAGSGVNVDIKQLSSINEIILKFHSSK